MSLAQPPAVPIAELNPNTTTLESTVHGIVTLVWPYSSVNQTFSFLLVEPDFRLRRSKGQVRISLRGSCARRVTRAGLVSGDEIRLSLNGVQWEKDNIAASTPGRGIEWDLLYTEHLMLEKSLEDGTTQTIDTNHMSSSPEPPTSSLPLYQASILPPSSSVIRGTPKKESLEPKSSYAWSSPIFLNHKQLPNIFPLKSDGDALQDDEEWESGPPTKKLKFGRKSDQWTFVGRSPSPEPSESELVEERIVFSGGEAGDSDLNIERYVASTNANPQAKIVYHSQAAEQDDMESTQPETVSVLPSEDASSISETTQTQTNNREAALNASQALFSESPLNSAGSTSTEHHQSDQADLGAAVEPKEQPVEPDNLAQTQVQSSDMLRTSSHRSALSLAERRSTANAAEMTFDVTVESATPLVLPLDTDLQPLTPRLLPLPSPGLALVSPIEQRKHPNVEYFEKQSEKKPKEKGSTKIEAPLRERNNPHAAALAAHGLYPPKQSQHGPVLPEPSVDAIAFRDARTEAQVDSQSDLHSAGYSIASIADAAIDGELFQPKDTLFDRLLAQYDQGTIQETGVTSNDFGPVAEPSKFAPSQVNAEVTDVRKPSSHEIGLLSSPLRDTQHSVENIDSLPEPVQQHSDSESEDEDSHKYGKHRDTTYQPTLAETTSDPAFSLQSPLLTDRLDSEQFPEAMHDVSASEDEGSEMDKPADLRGVVQDTYYANDEVKRDSSVAPEAENEAEVIDLLDSGPSSPTSELPSEHFPEIRKDSIQTESQYGNVPEDKSTPRTRNDPDMMDIDEIAAVREVEGETEPIAVVPKLEDETNEERFIDQTISPSSKTPSVKPSTSTEKQQSLETTSHESRIVFDQETTAQDDTLSDKAVIPEVIHDLQNDTQFGDDTRSIPDSQSQNFHTALEEFDAVVEEPLPDLESIPEEATTIDTVQETLKPISTKLPESPKKTKTSLSDLKSAKSQSTERETRSSRRITRSQSQQLPDNIDRQFEDVGEPEAVQQPQASADSTMELSKQGFRTSHDHYSTLPTLHEYYNTTTSVLAVVVASSKPVRSTAGPQDYNQTLYLAAPQASPNDNFTIAQLFRPYSSALPYPIPEHAVVLLKDFKVQSFKRKMSLLSTETSAWAILDYSSASNQSEMQVSIPGPPVEFGAAERDIAWGLGKWWNTLETDRKATVDKAARTARDKSEAELERKAVAAKAKRSSQTTPSRQKRNSQPHREIPETPASTDDLTTTRTREKHLLSSPTPKAAAKGARRHSRRSGSISDNLEIPETHIEHELRSGLTYSDNEEDLAQIPGRSLHEIGDSQQPHARAGSNAETGSATEEKAVPTRRSQRMARKKEGKEKEVWHELRDGSTWKDS